MHRIVREQLNERFTAYLDVDGTPVQRQFHEMSADEIVFAMRWHTAETQRLAVELTSFSAIFDEAMRGKGPNCIVGAELEQRFVELQKKLEVGDKAGRLLTLIKARISERNADTLLKARLHRLSLN